MPQLERLVVVVDAETAGLTNGLRSVARSTAATGGEIQGNFADIVPKSFQKTVEATDKAGHGFGRLESKLAGLAIATTGVDPHLGHLATTIGSMSLDGPIVLGVLAALGAIGFAYETLTEKTREARKETEDLINKLRQAHRERLGIPEGLAATDIIQRREALRNRMTLLRQQVDAGPPIADESGSFEKAQAGLALAKIEFDELGESLAELTAQNREKAGDLLKKQDDEWEKLFRQQNEMHLAMIGRLPTAAEILGPEKHPDMSAAPVADLARELMEALRKAAGGGLLTRDAQGNLPNAPDAVPDRFPTTERRSGFTGPTTPPTKADRGPFAEVGARLSSFAKGITGILGALNPWQFLLDAIGRALGDFIVNMTPVVEILGAALMPILKALFPIFKQLAIGATYVGQVLFTVAGWIDRVVGELVKGIGKFINWILPGNPANGLVKAGDALIGLGNGFLDASDSLGEARDKISALDWKDAADKVGEALSNIPEGLKLEQFRFDASRAASRTATSSAAAKGVTLRDTTINVYGVQNVKQLLKEIESEVRRSAAAGAQTLAFQGEE